MIDATISVNSTEFEAGMQRLKQGVRDGFISQQYGTLPVQARLLAERCQDFTPPRSVGQGKAAVARDLTVIYRPLSHTTFEGPSLRKIIKTDNRPAWDAAAMNFKGSHNLQNTKAIGFSSDWHERNKMSRGRGRRGKNGNLGVVTLGPEARRARAYIDIIKKRVGWARGGWNAGIIGFGGSVKAPWVSNKGMGGGWFQDGTSSPDPFVRVGNSTAWAKSGSGEGSRILANAISARARDMQAFFEHRMRAAANAATKAA